MSTLHYDDPIALVASPNFLPLLLIPDPGPLASGPAQSGDDMAVSFQQSEAVLRGTLAAALGLGLRLWLIGLALWAVDHFTAVWAAKRDPMFVKVTRRHLRIPGFLGV